MDVAGIYKGKPVFFLGVTCKRNTLFIVVPKTKALKSCLIRIANNFGIYDIIPTTNRQYALLQ